jgi:glucuronate isomerase
LLEQLAAVTKERDESLEQVAKLTDQAAADKATFDEQLAAVTKRAEEAEAALAEATKKAK